MNNQEPLFKSVFSNQWELLPEVFHARYANRADSDDLITLEGKLDIYFSSFMKWLTPLFNLFKAFVPYPGSLVPVTVCIRSHPNSSYLHFERTFHYPKQQVRFVSYLHVMKEDNVIEFISAGLGWRMKYSFDGNKIMLEHKGYVCKIFGRIISVPLSIFMGKLHVEEEALSKDSFHMLLQLTHPLFGSILTYGGEFKVAAVK